ncbi:MAG: methyltransferase domain-containing protein [Ignavibacteriales bacterium]|nr:methyltransferase domain-containing protein [Ignavibacteriales bacterium]
MLMNDEIENIKQRYAKRENLTSKYNILNPNVYLSEQEKERAIFKLFKKIPLKNYAEKKFLEIGGGIGTNVFLFLKFGFTPKNIFFNELIEDRFRKAKTLLPSEINFNFGNALDLNYPNEYFDIIFQSTVFSSILDEKFKIELASKMWNLVKNNGGILWYDFIYNNPWNKDVKGIPINEIKKLFPLAKIKIKKITLNPPLARFLTKINPTLYSVFNLIPLLRTHVLCWIGK